MYLFEMFRDGGLMKNNLRNYFPMIQTKETIREKINENEALLAIWEKWNTRRKEDFLDWCSGAKGVKMLYDSFFKEVKSFEHILYVNVVLSFSYISFLLLR